MKSNDRWINVSNYLIKQGNSYCVRIPGSVVKEIGTEEGDAVILRIKKFKPELTEGALAAYYDMARKKKALGIFSKDKITVMSTLFFNESKAINEVSGGKQMRSLAEGKRMMKASNKHREQIKKDFGEKFHQD